MFEMTHQLYCNKRINEELPRGRLFVYSLSSPESAQSHQVKPVSVCGPRGCGLNRDGKAATNTSGASQNNQPKQEVNILNRELMGSRGAAQAFGGVESETLKCAHWYAQQRASLRWMWAGYSELMGLTEEICIYGEELDTILAAESGINNVTGVNAEVRVPHSTQSAGKLHTRNRFALVSRGRG